MSLEHYEMAKNEQSGKWIIAMGCDNNGFEYKNRIKADFEAHPRVARVIDKGIKTGDDTTAYPHIAVVVATAVKDGKANRGLLVCGTGLGVAIAANKVSGIRAVTAHDSYSVERGVLSNNAQVLCMGQKVISVDLARTLAREWLEHEFDEKSASAAKVKVILEYEAENLKGRQGNSAFACDIGVWREVKEGKEKERGAGEELELEKMT